MGISRRGLLAGLFLGGVHFGINEPAHAQKRQITVGAASDLQFAFKEIGDDFEKRSGVKAVFSFGSTGALTQQIENGAPFDLFAAANMDFVTRLEKKGLVLPKTRKMYALGRIVIVSNKKASLVATELKHLLDPRIRVVAIANPVHAPYGLAAKQALEKSRLWDAVQPKVVLGENVRQTLQYVQTGNAEAGIVALSVAKVPEVSFTLIDQRLHAPLKQALCVLKGTRQESSARAFAAYINGKEGRKVMRKYGFLLPNERVDAP